MTYFILHPRTDIKYLLKSIFLAKTYLIIKFYHNYPATKQNSQATYSPNTSPLSHPNLPITSCDTILGQFPVFGIQLPAVTALSGLAMTTLVMRSVTSRPTFHRPL